MIRIGECPCCGGDRCALTYCFRLQATRFPTRSGGFVWKTRAPYKATGWQRRLGGVIVKEEHGIRGLPSGQGCVTPKNDLTVAQAQAQGVFDWPNEHRDPTS